jgi:hypothetical protein
MAISFWIQGIFPGREYGWSYVGFPHNTQCVISVSLDPSPSVMNGGESIWQLSVCHLLHWQRAILKIATFSKIFSRQYAMAYDSDNGRYIAFLVITTGFKSVIMTGVHMPLGSNP